jgi:fructose-bisphosphate aldolase, class II
MPYVRDARPLLRDAFERHYAIPSFNVCSLEMASAFVAAAEAERAPVMLQTYPGDLEHATPHVMAALVRALAEEASVPVLLHLDHGDSLERAAACIRAGYGSVMFDGEALSLDENVLAIAALARFAHPAGVAVEAAAGSFGGGEGHDDAVHLTEPGVASRLLREGGADTVAVSVGSLHGRASTLDLDRLRLIADATGGMLVLHGGSGIPTDDLAVAVRHGVVKLNIGMASVRALCDVWRREADGAADHYPVYRAAREALVEVGRGKLRATQASGKARP